jgi:hypothetical protein
MDQRCDCGMATPSLTCPVFLLEVGSKSFPSTSKVPPYESWESLTSQVFDAFLGVPMPPVSWGYLFKGFSPFPLPNTWSGSPTLPPPPPASFPPRSFPPSRLMIAFFSLPSKTEASSLGYFSLLTFLSSVEYISDILYFFFFLANIYLLVNTYHACPFGYELPHSG